jgi:hypothetical protein
LYVNEILELLEQIADEDELARAQAGDRQA